MNTDVINYTWQDFRGDITVALVELGRRDGYLTGIYGVPRGGVPLAVALSERLMLPIVSLDRVTKETLVVDDIIDSGRTRARFPDNQFFALHGRGNGQQGTMAMPTVVLHDNVTAWVRYPWESDVEINGEDIVVRSLQYIGEDPLRPGLVETPNRVVRAWKDLFSGYGKDPKAVLKSFSDAQYDEMVLVKNIEMYSMCEHHMLPFFGTAHIAYLPPESGDVLGASKLPRLLDIFARRLQIQERIGDQVTTVLMDDFSARGAACIIEASHLCMRMRGVEKQNSVLTTSSLKGMFLHNSALRNELLQLIK